MKISLQDRLMINSILPVEGSFIIITISGDIRRRLEITQDEIKKYDIKVINKGDKSVTKWSNEIDSTQEIIFTDLELKLLKDSVDELDNEKKITAELFGFCKKIKEEASAE